VDFQPDIIHLHLFTPNMLNVHAGLYLAVLPALVVLANWSIDILRYFSCTPATAVAGSAPFAFFSFCTLPQSGNGYFVPDAALVSPEIVFGRVPLPRSLRAANVFRRPRLSSDTPQRCCWTPDRLPLSPGSTAWLHTSIAIFL